jgi:PKD repeat protein
MRSASLSIIRIVTLSSLLLAQMVPTYAQEPVHPAATENISLFVGDIFEILPVHDIANATYTWILTQDRTFLEASRAPSFRKRLIQPGQYTLYAEIVAADGSRHLTRTIALDYAARQPGQSVPPATAPNGNALVVTEPTATADGKIAMAPGEQLVRLTPVNPEITPLSLDLDLNRDADGDGNNENDIQSSETFFHSDATPIYLWITDEPLTTHSISITAALPEGARTQKLEILSQELAQAQGVVHSPVQIQAEQTGERTYMFTAVFDNPAAAAGQLLYQWQFGDGEQSLVTQSEHTYAENGTFTVSLLVRNLRDGSEIASTSKLLDVTSETSAPSSQASSVDDEEPSTGGSSRFGIGSILMLGGLFIVSILLGVVIIFLIGKLRKGKTSLADKLESMEQTIVKTPAQETAPLTIAPPPPVSTPTSAPTAPAAPVTPAVMVETKRTAPPPTIAEREKQQAVERPAPAPTPKPQNTPPWLNPATPKPSPAATPAVPPSPAQTQKPVATPKPAQQGQTPAWLQQPSTPAAQKPPVAATPAPIQAPKPAAPVTPAPAPAPAPVMPKPAPVAPIATPVQAPTPAPTPVVPAPIVSNPAPVPPVEPKPAAPAQEMDILPASDQPIAIIRAESLNPQEGPASPKLASEDGQNS